MGIDSSPLTTGPYKDSLNPFKELTDGEKQVWEAIMTDAFDQFKGVIKAGRANSRRSRHRRTGDRAGLHGQAVLENGLVDEIGFEDDALAALAENLGLDDPQIVKFEYPPTLTELLLGKFQQPEVSHPWQLLLEAGVPKAMYLCGWNAGVSYPAMQ